ncbi:hypothetical protein [uncultured Flavobacterium sp.]|uniref:hypothetical protein n=1 Tax=uncultured Flavobacterium sp. TaxID=165435 RepID=UPI0030EBE591|tara:strand:- start:1462 stop:1863 length:402 start_codon:yes stop_codon:yes gene_type:complete
MKVKVLLALLLFITSISIKAQETKSSCDFEYSIDIKSTENKGSAIFNWDISKNKDKTIEVIVEIVPIKDCYNNEKATRYRETVFFNLKSIELIDKNSIETNTDKLRSKCFKWRVVIKSDVCTKKYDWNYYSLL